MWNEVGTADLADLALYAVHLPLDAHPHYGNNYELARATAPRSILGREAAQGREAGHYGILSLDASAAVGRGLRGRRSPRRRSR